MTFERQAMAQGAGGDLTNLGGAKTRPNKPA
jgi:hypothetical protein